MPEVEGEAVVKGKVKCPCCGKEFEAEIEGSVSLEFELSDYAPERDEA
jgi:hypothetical protein